MPALLAEHRKELFPDEMFADLFPSGRGRSSVPADVIAAVMVLQSLEGLSDREAMRRLETDITWKAACGLSLTDTAFHPTVLDDAVQDTISLLVSAIRKVRKLIPVLAEKVFVREQNLEGSRPLYDWDDPADVERLVTELVDDAYELIWAAEDLALALVAGQDVEPGERPGTWRITRGTAPDRVISTVDPESRHAHKTQHSYRDGFKADLAAEPETGLVTSTDLTAGNEGDAEAAPGLIADEPAGTEVCSAIPATGRTSSATIWRTRR